MTLRGILHRLLRRSGEREMAEEFESHLALHIDDNIRTGMSPEEARRAALLKFGSMEAAKESYRDHSGFLVLEQTAQDLRYAARTFRRSPVFAITAVATLGIGIGASVAVFSAIDPLLFRSLPYPNDRQLVSFGYFGPVDTNEFALVSSYLDWRKQPGPFQSMTSMRPLVSCDLASADAAVQLRCAAVEANFLGTLGLRPALGRDFTSEDDQIGARPVALISDRLWRGTFSSDTQILNREVMVDAVAHRIVGVLSASFELPQSGEADILQTARYRVNAPRADNASAPLRAFGRLRDGVSVEQGRAQMLPLMRAAGALDVPKPLQSEVSYVFQSIRDRRIRDVKSASWMLLAAVLGLLLLACANVANLLLARGAARSKEMAMRLAIGAGRWRLVRQMLTESLLLALGGCAAGCLLGWTLLKLFVTVAPQGLMGLERAAVDTRAVLFALLAAVASVLFFGLFPALRNVNPNGKALLRRVLVSAQVALSLLLLTGASMFLKSLVNLKHQSLGFAPERIVTASFTLRSPRYNAPASQAAFALDIEQRLSRLVGASAFAIADSVPPSGTASGRPFSNMRVEDRPPLTANGGMVVFRRVTPYYFQTMQVRLIAGRIFTEQDRSASEEPLILSAALAAKMFGSENPLGHRVALSNEEWCRVIGVVADVRNSGLAEPAAPEYYRLRMHNGRQVGRSTVALFRTDTPVATLAAFIKREIAAVDPTLPVEVASMATRVEALQDRPRFLAYLISAFALAGWLLAATGLYGVLSFLVAQRRREVGVRLAIGASSIHIASIILKQAVGWTLAGALAGAVGAFLLAGSLRGLLFHVTPYDPESLLKAATLLLFAAFLAAWLPALRATKIDPAETLRPE